jgi:hypothetical protein
LRKRCNIHWQYHISLPSSPILDTSSECKAVQYRDLLRSNIKPVMCDQREPTPRYIAYSTISSSLMLYKLFSLFIWTIFHSANRLSSPLRYSSKALYTLTNHADENQISMTVSCKRSHALLLVCSISPSGPNSGSPILMDIDESVLYFLRPIAAVLWSITMFFVGLR